ncbi:tetratricopeptide repeat protein [Chitinivorax sp. B]|uniref:tetratricopeptide repeat protein n=1 Tax=Chitinivorax sp. B TaxID=2502235 RepID=UPI0010F5F1E4|nr:tetratricopeptide repeat protein [Chitinivorax sp. B]
MKLRFTLLTFATLFSLNTYACLNTYEEVETIVNEQGEKIDARNVLNILEWDYKEANNYAVELILSHQHPKAIELLLAIEDKFPDHFRTAANLGTAYELAGSNELALKWIKEGVQRNPQDHQGTEWLHVKILEAKLAMQQQPDWLASHTVTGLDFGKQVKPILPTTIPADFLGQPRTLDDYRKALSYQLTERMKLVKPHDAIVADLLFTQADLASLAGQDNAATLYRSALDYGATKHVLARTRLQGLPDDEAGVWIAATVAGGVLLLGGWVGFVKRRKKMDRDE